MINEIELNSWIEFEEKIQHLLRYQRDTLINEMGVPYLFRGHSDSTWRLETTLDRYVNPNLKTSFYRLLTAEILPEIETFIGKKMDFQKHENPDVLLEHVELDYEYMTYLRHYGFPSPLLDWSYSPYIAAYFAFREMGSKANSVAIYAHIQNLDKINRPPGGPSIEYLFSNEGIKNNKRHYLQQSEYTICTRKENDVVYFANHEDGYSQKKEAGDNLIKYIIPASERGMALLSLESYNINAYSLIGSEESLLETLFIRHFSMRKARKEMYPDSGGSDY